MIRPFLLLVLLFGAAGAHAQGIIVGPDRRPADLTLQAHRIDADVQDRVAVVEVEHAFHNPGKRTVEGTFLFPLPPEAQVTRFSMEVDGQELAGELLEAEEARRIYEDIVRRSLDPALLEMADYRTFRARVFPIPAGETRTITLRYDAVLPMEDGTVRFRYPLQGSLAARGTAPPRHPIPLPIPRRRPVPEEREVPSTEPTHSRLHVEIAGRDPISTIYSPSHEVEVDRQGARRAAVTLENGGGLGGRDFILYYRLDARDVGATLLTHRPYGDRAGYFLLLLTPPHETGTGEVAPKDVVFVLDTSGSMAGEKIAQAKEALRYALRRLGPRDRFGVVAFSSDVDPFRRELTPVGARDDALYFVDQLEARGGTNIHAALLSAVEMLEGSDHGLVIFLTDGLPSVGVTDEGAIRREVADANREDVRLFSFGVGYDVNTRLLDGLSQSSGAFADYISPDENIEERVSTFYEKVRYPFLTDLELEIDGVDAYALTPGRLPDLYRGGQLVLAGRYRRPGRGTLTLRGRLGEEAQALTYRFRFPERERERDFVARLWATRRVGALLDEIRLHGENEELKEEIVALAKEFGLVTPYTSYLVREEEMMVQAQPGGRRAGAVRLQGAPAAADALQETSGEAAVQMSKSIRAMQEARVASETAPAGLVAVQGRTMQQTSEGTWVDLDFDPEEDRPLKIQFASDTYFRLLRLYPEARAFARLGTAVVFKLGDTFVQIGEEGEDLGEAELRARFG